MTDLKDFSEQFEAWWLTKFSAEFLDSDNCWSAWTGWQARGVLDAVRIKDLTALVVQQDKDNNNYAKEIIELTAKNKVLEAEVKKWQTNSVDLEYKCLDKNLRIDELTAKNKELLGYIKMMDAQLTRHGVTYKLDGISISEALQEIDR